VIRQAISCDICGAEKKQTNHWFIANEQGGELRISGWSTRVRLRAGARHLCGQTCLHKLVDEFMARSIDGRAAVTVVEAPTPTQSRIATDASLTSTTAYRSRPVEAAARKSDPPTVLPTVLPTAAVVVPIQSPPAATPHGLTIAPVDDVPNYASRRWRAEAWDRALHSDQHNGSGARHRKTL
jgi:hypothetical protein